MAETVYPADRTAAGAGDARDLALFGLAALGLGALSLWLLGHGWGSEIGMRRWAQVLGVLDADGLRIENLGLIYPHLPYYLLMPFYYVPGLRAPAAPYLVSALLTALLLVLWYRRLLPAGFTRRQRLVLLVLVTIQPALLWSGTNGGQAALSVLLFYLLYRSCLRMIYEQDVRSFIALGIVLGVYFFADAVTFFLFIALLPLITLIAPRRILMESPLSVYVIVTTPLAVAVGSWIYLNWIFHGDALGFLSDPRSGWLGGWSEAPGSAWLRTYGGDWLRPIGAGLVLMAASFPAVIFLLLSASRYGPHLRAALVLFLHPVIAMGFATERFYLVSPMEILVLILGGIMAELTQVKAGHHKAFPTLAAFLLVGALSGWMVFAASDEPGAGRWLGALRGQTQAPAAAGDLALGRWLAASRLTTLLDDRTGYRVIIARGDARDLALPFSDTFKLQLRRGHPDVPQIAVPDPSSRRGREDRINQRFPRLYAHGLPGYRRVYDRDGWRVYRHAG